MPPIVEGGMVQAIGQLPLKVRNCPIPCNTFLKYCGGMRLSQQAIEDFKKIFKKEYGEDISDAEAEEMAIRFLRLFSLIYRPIPEDAENTKNPSSVCYC